MSAYRRFIDGWVGPDRAPSGGMAFFLGWGVLVAQMTVISVIAMLVMPALSEGLASTARIGIVAIAVTTIIYMIHRRRVLVQNLSAEKSNG